MTRHGALEYHLYDAQGSSSAFGGRAIADQSELSYYIYRLLGALVPLIPPKIGYRLFDRLGELSYNRSKQVRDNVLDNLRHVMGDKADPEQLALVARQVFRLQARNYYDLFRVPTLSPEGIARTTSLHGEENIKRAEAEGKGVILVSAHLGNVELVSCAVCARGYRVMGPMEHVRPERLYQYLVSLRSRCGLIPVPTDGFMRPLFRTLRAGGIVAIASDRNPSGTGVVVPFFGAPALLPDGHVQLAIRTGAALVPAFGMRNPDNTVSAYIFPPIKPEFTGDRDTDMHRAMELVVQALEGYIRQHPEQWVMFQPVWRLPKDVQA